MSLKFKILVGLVCIAAISCGRIENSKNIKNNENKEVGSSDEAAKLSADRLSSLMKDLNGYEINLVHTDVAAYYERRDYKRYKASNIKMFDLELMSIRKASGVNTTIPSIILMDNTKIETSSNGNYKVGMLEKDEAELKIAHMNAVLDIAKKHDVDLLISFDRFYDEMDFMLLSSDAPLKYPSEEDLKKTIMSSEEIEQLGVDLEYSVQNFKGFELGSGFASVCKELYLIKNDESSIELDGCFKILGDSSEQLNKLIDLMEYAKLMGFERVSIVEGGEDLGYKGFRLHSLK